MFLLFLFRSSRFYFFKCQWSQSSQWSQSVEIMNLIEVSLVFTYLWFRVKSWLLKSWFLNRKHVKSLQGLSTPSGFSQPPLACKELPRLRPQFEVSVLILVLPVQQGPVLRRLGKTVRLLPCGRAYFKGAQPTVLPCCKELSPYCLWHWLWFFISLLFREHASFTRWHQTIFGGSPASDKSFYKVSKFLWYGSFGDLALQRKAKDDICVFLYVKYDFMWPQTARPRLPKLDVALL